MIIRQFTSAKNIYCYLIFWGVKLTSGSIVYYHSNKRLFKKWSIGIQTKLKYFINFRFPVAGPWTNKNREKNEHSAFDAEFSLNSYKLKWRVWQYSEGEKFFVSLNAYNKIPHLPFSVHRVSFPYKSSFLIQLLHYFPSMMNY